MTLSGSASPPSPLFGTGQNSPFAVVTTLTDVTARKRDEQSAGSGPGRLDLAIRGADTGYWDLDLTTGLIHHEPGWMARVLGYHTGPALPGIHAIEELMNPEDRAPASEQLRRILHGESDQFDSEYRLLSASGNYRWIHSRGSVVARDAAGSPSRIAGTCEEIGERKLIEHQRLHALQQIRALLDALPGFTFCKDTDGVYLSANKTLCDHLGIAPNQIIGKTDAELFRPIWPISIVRPTTGCCHRRAAEIARTPSTDSSSPAERCRYVSEDGQIVGLVGLAVDITERKRNEDLTAHLAAGVGPPCWPPSRAPDHNHMTVVLGFSKLPSSASPMRRTPP